MASAIAPCCISRSAKLAEQVGMIGPQLRGPLEGCGCLVGLTQPLFGLAEFNPSLCKVGAELHGLAKVGQGVPVFALGGQGVAQVAVRRVVIRLESQGLTVAFGGLLWLTLARQGDAQIVVCLDQVWAEPDGLAEAVDGLDQPALLHEGDTQVVVQFDLAGTQAEGSAKAADRLVVMTESMVHAAEAGPDLGVIGLVPQGLAVEDLGVGQSAEALEAGGEGCKVRRSDHG